MNGVRTHNVIGDILCLYDLSIGLWNCSDSMVFCCFSLYISKDIDCQRMKSYIKSTNIDNAFARQSMMEHYR